MIVLVDYGGGNLRSVAKALEVVVPPTGGRFIVSSRPEDVAAAEVLVLPGQGAAPDIMRSLRCLGLVEPLKEGIATKPYLGICIGLQMLLDTSEEGDTSCLGVIPGNVRRLPEGLKVPHMGWNQVRQVQQHPVFAAIPDNANFYFVHSYYADPVDKTWVAGETEYGVALCSAIARGKMVATQFHPEKSGRWGIKFLQNFLRFAKEGG